MTGPGAGWTHSITACVAEKPAGSVEVVWTRKERRHGLFKVSWQVHYERVFLFKVEDKISERMDDSQVDRNIETTKINFSRTGWHPQYQLSFHVLYSFEHNELWLSSRWRFPLGTATLIQANNTHPFSIDSTVPIQSNNTHPFSISINPFSINTVTKIPESVGLQIQMKHSLLQLLSHFPLFSSYDSWLLISTNFVVAAQNDKPHSNRH